MKILKNQHWHFLILLVLLCALYFYIKANSSALRGSLYGFDTLYWMLLAVLSPIFHQLYVLICWRSELYYKGISKRFGALGFRIYKAGFALLILSRIVTIVFLAISNAATFHLNIYITLLFIALLLIPAVYLFYSVKRYFGIDKAFGQDHFEPQRFRSEAFVKEGIFKYTSNGMYIFGFLILYIPGLLWQSEAAIILALFNHLYIWVHYYFTELPDIKVIYKGDNYHSGSAC